MGALLLLSIVQDSHTPTRVSCHGSFQPVKVVKAGTVVKVHQYIADRAEKDSIQLFLKSAISEDFTNQLRDSTSEIK